MNAETMAAYDAADVTYASMWDLPVVPLDRFMSNCGLSPNSYYKLHSDGLRIPTIKIGRKRFVVMSKARELFVNLPIEK